MNTKEATEFLNDLLSVIRQDERSHEARLTEIKNRIYSKQSALALNGYLPAAKSEKREQTGDILFA